MWVPCHRRPFLQRHFPPDGNKSDRRRGGYALDPVGRGHRVAFENQVKLRAGELYFSSASVAGQCFDHDKGGGVPKSHAPVIVVRVAEAHLVPAAVFVANCVCFHVPPPGTGRCR